MEERCGVCADADEAEAEPPGSRHERLHIIQAGMVRTQSPEDENGLMEPWIGVKRKGGKAVSETWIRRRRQEDAQCGAALHFS